MFREEHGREHSAVMVVSYSSSFSLWCLDVKQVGGTRLNILFFGVLEKLSCVSEFAQWLITSVLL